MKGDISPASELASGTGAERVVGLGEDTTAAVLVAAADVGAANVLLGPRLQSVRI